MGSYNPELKERTCIMYALIDKKTFPTPDILNEETLEQTEVLNNEIHEEHIMDMKDLQHMMMTNLGFVLIAIICASFLIPFAVFVSSQIFEKCCRMNEKAKRIDLKEKRVKPVKITTV